MVDRNGVIYTSQVVPGFVIGGVKTENTDPFLKKDIHWLIEGRINKD
jgi:hypothetical protein